MMPATMPTAAGPTGVTEMCNPPTNADDWNGYSIIGYANGACWWVILGQAVWTTAGFSDADCLSKDNWDTSAGQYSSTDAGIQSFVGGTGTCYSGSGRASGVTVMRIGPRISVRENPKCYY